MPANKKATMRYFVIDKCLRDHNRIWHWQDLQTEITRHMSEFRVEDIQPSRRTIMGDIHAMRSGELGYIAPIYHTKHEGYRYADRSFSIFKSPVPPTLSEMLKEVISLIQQSLGNNLQNEMVQSLARLAEFLHISVDREYRPLIQLEHSLNDPGYRWLDTFYNFIKENKSVRISYTPFEGPDALHLLSPWFIKEYNNRWYVFGHHYGSGKMYNLALDRVTEVQESIRPYIPCDYDYVDGIFNDLYGVTIPEGATPVTFTLSVTPLLSRYLETKPLHPSQVRVPDKGGKVIFTIRVFDNYEIRSKLRSFGEDLEVVDVR